MSALVAVVLLSACYEAEAYVDYHDAEDVANDDADFDYQYDTETKDIVTTTVLTTLGESEGTDNFHNRIRRFGDRSSGVRTLSLDEIEDVKGALKELLAGHQVDSLDWTTGLETMTNVDDDTNTFEMFTKDFFTGLTKITDSEDLTKFYEDLVEEILENAKKQGQLTTTNVRRTETNTVFEIQTEKVSFNAEKPYGVTNKNNELFTRNQNLRKRDGPKRPKYPSKKEFPYHNINDFPSWVRNFPDIVPDAPKRTPTPENVKFTFKSTEEGEIDFASRTPIKEISKNSTIDTDKEYEANEDLATNYNDANRNEKEKGVETADKMNIIGDRIRLRQGDTTTTGMTTDTTSDTTNKMTTDTKSDTTNKMTTDKTDTMTTSTTTPTTTTTEDSLNITPPPTTTRRTRKTTMPMADPHYYPYPYSTRHYPEKTTTNATTIWRTKRRKTTTPPITTTLGPLVDINALVALVANLTAHFESNITEVFNKTLQKYNVPTCPSLQITEPVIFYDLTNATVVAKCFVCGLHTEGIPADTYCNDAFATDFIPLVPIDPLAIGHLVEFRKYCRYLDVHNFYENSTEPRSVYGRFTGGCSVRWIDLSGIYTQRACRNRRRAMTGNHFASKRMAKLEMALNDLDNGCMVSPMASLVPLSRGISLFARFHACVCTGSWCNITTVNRPWVMYIAMLVCWTINTSVKGRVGEYWFYTI